jgi:hypothetical protein
VSGGTRQLRQPAHEGAADAEDVKVQGVILSMPGAGGLAARMPSPQQAPLCDATRARILGKPGSKRSRRLGRPHRYTGRRASDPGRFDPPTRCEQLGRTPHAPPDARRPFHA